MSDSYGFESHSTSPKTAKSRTARAQPGAHRYHFPQSGRRIGGSMTVTEASADLLRTYWMHRACVRTLAGGLIRIGHQELKLELAHHLYQHSEAAVALRSRLRELRVSEKSLDEGSPSWLEVAINEILLIEDTVSLVVCLRKVLLDPLVIHLKSYLLAADGLLDQPSIRILRRVHGDVESMQAWHEKVEQAATAAGDEPAAWSKLAKHISIKVTQVQREGILPTECPTYVRPDQCERDDRFSTFHHTRSYDAEGASVAKTDETLASECFELFRVQRDELDAIETFANVIFDLRPSFELEAMLARLVWDEARHAEMGQQNLERLGYEPFSIPCGIIGINVRSPLPPLIAFAQISIFGELNQVGTLKRIADRCYEEGDRDSARAFDYTHADEMMHLRVGRQWLTKLAASAGMSLEALEESARQHAIRRLREEGVVGEDYANRITASDLAALIGE